MHPSPAQRGRPAQPATRQAGGWRHQFISKAELFLQCGESWAVWVCLNSKLGSAPKDLFKTQVLDGQDGSVGKGASATKHGDLSSIPQNPSFWGKRASYPLTSTGTMWLSARTHTRHTCTPIK